MRDHSLPAALVYQRWSAEVPFDDLNRLETQLHPLMAFDHSLA
jgi:hypothetical protein